MNNSPFKPQIKVIEPTSADLPVLPELIPYGKKPIQTSNAPMQVLKPMGTVETVSPDEIEALETEIARSQVSKNPMYEKSPEEQELQQKSIAYLLNQLDKPNYRNNYLTIQDMIKGTDMSGKGFYHSPDNVSALASLFGGANIYNPKTGRPEDLTAPIVLNNERRVLQEQAREDEQQKQQNALVNSIYNSMSDIDKQAMIEDRFIRTLAANQQAQQYKAEQDRIEREEKQAQTNFENDYKIKQLEETIRHNQTVEQNKENQPRKPLSDKQTNDLSDMEKSINNLVNLYNKYTNADEGLFGQKGAIRAGLAKEHPYAYAPFDNEITLTRQDLELLRQKYAKALEGGRMSDQDRTFYQNVLLSQSLTKENLLKAMRDVIKAEKEAYNIRLKGIERQNRDIDDYEYYDVEETNKNNNITKMKAPNGKVYEVPNDKVEEMKQKGGVVI